MKIMKKNFFMKLVCTIQAILKALQRPNSKKSLKRKKFARFIFLVKNEVRYENVSYYKTTHNKCFFLSFYVMVSLPSSFYANVLHHVLQLSTHIIELYFMNHGSVFFTMALLSFVRWIMDGYKINGRLYSSGSPIQTFLLR